MPTLRSTSVAVPTGAEVQAQIEKLLSSSPFSSSVTLGSLLRYLAQRTFESPDNPPKEHEIATSLFGSPTTFDPKLDPLVRVQVSRLRSKLAEYYVVEGLSDGVYIDVPKGSYRLRATYRGQVLAPSPAFGTVPAGPWRSRQMLLIAGLPLLLAVAALAIWKLGPSSDQEGLKQFWRPFLESSKETLVIFANPKLVGSSATSLRLYDPDKDEGAVVNPSFSGAGEVMGAAELSGALSRLGRRIRLKPSQIFTWDDANVYNLIFMGAPPHNVSLFRLPLGRKLKFKPFGEDPRKQEGCIHNPQPQKGEADFYCSSSDGATSTEYALVALSDGMQNDKIVLVAAGTTTFSTQAAIDFLCNPKRVPEIARLLGVRRGERLPPFDALIRCRIRSGAPVSAELVLVKQ